MKIIRIDIVYKSKLVDLIVDDPYFTMKSVYPVPYQNWTVYILSEKRKTEDQLLYEDQLWYNGN